MHTIVSCTLSYPVHYHVTHTTVSCHVWSPVIDCGISSTLYRAVLSIDALRASVVSSSSSSFFFFFFPDEETVAAGAPVSVRIRSGETLIEQRLASLGTEPVVMGDDGNCQFRALSFQVVVGGGGRVESRSAISMSSHRISDESLRLSLLFLLLVSRSCKLSSSGRRTTTHMSGGASCST